MKRPPTHEEGGAPAPVFQFLHAISHATKPVVASVSGAAVGIGTTLLFHCDLVYAGDNAAFSMPFVNLGLCPEAASSLLLPQIAGHQRAAEMLILGKKIDAARARDFGFVNEVVAPDGLEDAAMGAARVTRVNTSTQTSRYLFHPWNVNMSAVSH